MLCRTSAPRMLSWWCIGSNCWCLQHYSDNAAWPSWTWELILMWGYSTFAFAYNIRWSTSSRLNLLVYLSMRYTFYAAFDTWLCWTLESVSFSVWSKVLVLPVLADWLELVSVVRLNLLVYLGWTCQSFISVWSKVLVLHLVVDLSV